MTVRHLAASLACFALIASGGAVAAQRGPAPGTTGLPADILVRACAPAMTSSSPAGSLRVTGGQDGAPRLSYLPGDLVTINGGATSGISVGQRFFVRRTLVSRREPINERTPATVHTAGWIEVYAVDEAMSLATITHACDSIEVGDYLEPFAPPQDVPAAARPQPERGNYGRVLLGQDRRRTFGRGDYLVVDRGSDDGVTAGMHFVLYRDKRLRDNFLFEIGEAVAVDVKADSATLHVTVSLDAIQEGDYAAMRR